MNEISFPEKDQVLYKKHRFFMLITKQDRAPREINTQFKESIVSDSLFSLLADQ